MDGLMKLSRDTQIVIGGAVLLLIVSFLDWQQVSYLGITAGASEWHGIGLLAGLLLIALLAWEGVRLFGVKISMGSLSDGLVSVGLALLVALFTVIYFLTHTDAQHWPAYLGLLLAIVIAVASVMRAKGEGVQMPEMSGSSTSTSSTSTSPTGGSTTGGTPMGDDSSADDAPGGTAP